MINSGTLTDKLSFYEPIETTSPSGYKKSDEKLICTVRAYRLKNKENYGVDAEALYHSTELQFQLRMRPDLKETDIVVYDGNRYRITSFSPYKAENQLTIMLAKIND